MKKKEANYLDTKKRVNPLKVLAIIAGIVLVFGIISYATNYSANEQNRHKTIEDVMEAMNHTPGESGTTTSGSGQEWTTTTTVEV